MFVTMRMVANPAIMGKFVLGRRLQMLGWLATVVMALAVAVMLVQVLRRRGTKRQKNGGPSSPPSGAAWAADARLQRPRVKRAVTDS